MLAGGGCLDIFTLVCHFFLLSPSLGDGLIQTEILSQKAVKPKTTNQPTFNLVTQVSDSGSHGALVSFFHYKRYSVIWGSQPLRARNRQVEFEFLPNMPEILIYI